LRCKAPASPPEGGERLRRDGDEQPGADETADHAIDGQGPVDPDPARPPAALEDVGHIEDRRWEHYEKNRRAHIGDHGQQGVAIMGKPMPMVPEWMRTVMDDAVSIGIIDLSSVSGSTQTY
jgi:hypothetical protein